MGSGNREGFSADGQYRDTCGKCGARRIDQQIGLEATPEEWRDRLVEVFRELRRVLVPTGTLWVECGDSYGAANNRNSGGRQTTPTDGSERDEHLSFNEGTYRKIAGLKPKDLIGSPFLLAFGLRDDGWWWRSTNIWHKPNCLPESVTDRPVVSHSYVFQFSKKARYFHDAEAVREPVDWEYLQARTGGNAHGRGWPDEMGGKGTSASGRTGKSAHVGTNPNGRSLRSVWTIPTQGFSGRELFGGDGRIPSPDCPVHGDRPGEVPTARRGVREGAQASRTPRTDTRHVQEPLDALVPTEPIREPDSAQSSSDSQHHASTATAIPSSTQTRKTSSRSGERDTAFEETPDHTPDSEPSHERLALDDSQDLAPSETGDRKSRTSGLTGGAYSSPGQTPHGNARRPDPKACTCQYIDHFATWPTKLAERILLMACPESVCRVCGVPRTRITSTEYDDEGRTTNGPRSLEQRHETPGFDVRRVKTTSTQGFTDCGHSDYRPGICLDPFVGSGTTCHVARKLGRRSVGIDLSAEYLDLAARRLQQQSLFA